MGCCSCFNGCGNGGERRGVCSDACCPIRGVLVGQRVVQEDGWSGHSSSAVRHSSYLLKEVEASKTGEFDESVHLDGHLPVALGKALAR